MIAEYYGISTTVEEARSVIGFTRDDGATSYEELELMASFYGLNLSRIESYYDGIVIAHVNTSKIPERNYTYSAGHYVVIYDQDDVYFYVHDPLGGPSQKYNKDDFIEATYAFFQAR